MSRAWWRRNRWALPAMAVALAGLAWPASEVARDTWWPRGEHVARAPGSDGWATAGGLSLRLAAFGPAEDLPHDPVPDGYTAWRAELAARGDGEPLACTAQLQDGDGRRYASGSRYLPSYDDRSISVECGGGPEAGGVVYFLLPDDAEPHAVRVSALQLLPEYWELRVP